MYNITVSVSDVLHMLQAALSKWNNMAIAISYHRHYVAVDLILSLMDV